MNIWFRTTVRRGLITGILMTAGLPAWAGWTLENIGPVEPNSNTVITLVHTGESAMVPGTLWLSATGQTEVILPATIEATGNKVFVPVFARGVGSSAISILDSSDRSVSEITLEVASRKTTGQAPWLPKLRIDGEEGLPVVFAQKSTTAILELTPGTGEMPPTTHISATDHRGRMVLSRFYQTFELAAGTETVELPAAGEYMMTVKLVSESPDQMPRARYRTPIPIPFGRTTTQYETGETREGVTTETVVGSRVALEHLPTTATVVGIDRLRVVAIGRHSKEIQKNQWPYVIAGADLSLLPNDQRMTEGGRRLQWQRRLGSSYAPVSVDWSQIQRGPGSFYWSPLGDILPLYRKLMVRPLVMLSGRSAWSNELPTETSSTLRAWKNLVANIGDQYMEVMWGFYCWNKPDQSWQWPKDYVTLLLETADGLQNRNGERRPSSALVAGPLNNFNASYLDGILTSETIPLLSGISYELMPAQANSSPEASGFELRLARTADLLKKKGADKVSIWLTGTGWPIGPDGVTEELQANYLVRTHVIALANGVTKVTWYDLIDRTDHAAGSKERAQLGRWGLLDAQFMPKPSGVAYNVMTYMLSGATSPTVTRQGSATITSFNLPLQSNKWPSTVYVAWTDSPQKQQTVQLDIKRGGGVYAFDYLGAEIATEKIAGDSADPISGTYSLTVGYEPVYIWDAGKPASR